MLEEASEEGGEVEEAEEDGKVASRGRGEAAAKEVVVQARGDEGEALMVEVVAAKEAGVEEVWVCQCLLYPGQVIDS